MILGNTNNKIQPQNKNWHTSCYIYIKAIDNLTSRTLSVGRRFESGQSVTTVAQWVEQQPLDCLFSLCEAMDVLTSTLYESTRLLI